MRGGGGAASDARRGRGARLLLAFVGHTPGGVVHLPERGLRAQLDTGFRLGLLGQNALTATLGPDGDRQHGDEETETDDQNETAKKEKRAHDGIRREKPATSPAMSMVCWLAMSCSRPAACGTALASCASASATRATPCMARLVT